MRPEKLQDVAYKPSEWGALYHSLPYTEVLGAGAAGPGKSLCLLMDPFDRIANAHERCLKRSDHDHPLYWGECTGWALHLRRTRPRLEQTIARSKRIFPRIDPTVRWEEDKTMWTFQSGYRLQFGHCKDPDDWENYLSNEYDWIGFDELVEFEEEQYQNIILRLRSWDPVFGDEKGNWLKIRTMSNPLIKQSHGDRISVKNPNWVRDLFVKPAPEGSVVFEREIDMGDGSPPVKFTRMYLRATIEDNPDEKARRIYKARLLSAPSVQRQAMLYGNWWVTSGSHFAGEWNENLHVCSPFEIPDGWARFRTMDWGFRVFGCVHWWALSPDDVLYCEREFMFRLMVDKDVAKRVREIEKGMRLWHNGKSRISGPADKQLWEERGESAPSKASIFFAHGVPWFPADQKSRAHNAERVAKRLCDHDNGKKSPGIVFFRTCKKMIEVIPSIQTDKDDPSVPQWGGDDHAYDNCSYACAYADRGLSGVSKMRPIDDLHDPDGPGLELETAELGRGGYGNRVL
jgi:hypothetical protein